MTAFGQKKPVSYLAVPYSLSLIKHTACSLLRVVESVTTAKNFLFPRSVVRTPKGASKHAFRNWREGKTIPAAAAPPSRPHQPPSRV